MSKLVSVSSIVTLIVLTSALSCDQERYPQGKLIYERYCANCHMSEGKGLGEIYPSLVDSPYLSSDQESLVCLIKKGKKSTQLSTVYMPAHDLSEVEMINLINYLSHKLSSTSAISPLQVREALVACP